MVVILCLVSPETVTLNVPAVKQKPLFTLELKMGEKVTFLLQTTVDLWPFFLLLLLPSGW